MKNEVTQEKGIQGQDLFIKFADAGLVKFLLGSFGIEYPDYTEGPFIQTTFSLDFEDYAERMAQFDGMHEVMHVTLFFYFNWLFSEILPKEILLFRFYINASYREMKILPSLLSQSNRFIEKILGQLDFRYRFNSIPASNTFSENSFIGEMSFETRAIALQFLMAPQEQTKHLERIAGLLAAGIIFSTCPVDNFSAVATYKQEIKLLRDQIFTECSYETRSSSSNTANIKEFDRMTNVLNWLIHFVFDVRRSSVNSQDSYQNPYCFENWLLNLYQGNLDLDISIESAKKLMEDDLTALKSN